MDIQGRLKGTDAATAAKQAIQTAHMFGAYTPGAMQKVWNQVALLVDGDPLSNIKLVDDAGKNFVVIMKDGKLHKNTLTSPP